MKHTLQTIALLVATFISSVAQEAPLTNLKFSDGVMQYPALTGGSGGSAYISSRNGLGLNGAGKSQLIGGHLLFKQKLGFGLSMYHERLNVLDNYNISLQNAYHIPLGQKRILSFGIGAEGHYSAIGTSHLVEVDINDPRILQGNTWAIDFVPSIAFQTKNLKIAVAHNRFVSSLNTTESNTYLNPYINILTLYKWKLSDKILLEPSYILRYSQQQKTFRNDIQLMSIFNNQYFIGLTWRSEQIINTSIGIQLNHKYIIGYSYQTSVGDLVSLYGANTHEIILRLNLNEQYFNREDFLLESKPIRTIKNYRR